MSRLLEEEINLIGNNSLKKSLRTFIDKWESKLIHMPCSFSGKYHPPEERGSGGLVLHIKRMCKLANGLKTQLSIDDNSFDILIAAIILHDMSNLMIYEMNDEGKWIGNRELYKEWHEELSYAMFIPHFAPDVPLTSDLPLRLQALIHSHTGGWTPQNKQPYRKLEIILSTLDYIDSREYVHVEV